MHEGSHQIFKMLFPNDYGVTQKSAGVHYYKANSERNKPISDWEEMAGKHAWSCYSSS